MFDLIKDWLLADRQVVAFLGATFTAICGFCAWLFAYWREIKRRNFETFFKMRGEFRTNERFGRVFKALNGDPATMRPKSGPIGALLGRKDDGSPEITLDQISHDDAEEFAGFLEEVAILVQSKVISPKLAHYFFGYYAIVVVNNPSFMEKIEDEETREYWGLLRSFSKLMEREQKRLKLKPQTVDQLVL
jgi:hypothetical protein